MADNERDPLYHTRRIKGMLQDVMQHIREDMQKIGEPQAKSMFEISAETIGGLVKSL